MISNRSSDSTVSASTSWTIWYDNTTDQNLRSSAADALLWAPDQQRKKLTVVWKSLQHPTPDYPIVIQGAELTIRSQLTNHKVDKVTFSGNLTASGVIFGVSRKSNVYNSLTGAHYVHARKEVILSAGALASASVLERSGVGNLSILQAADVQALVDLPGVGSNLVDQPGAAFSALVAEKFHNDTGFFDKGNVFAPIISLVNIEQIWQRGECLVQLTWSLHYVCTY